ncbi:MAG: hypothetical protein WB949_09615, partial [Candidatus Acidiferrales bacterium]
GSRTMPKNGIFRVIWASRFLPAANAVEYYLSLAPGNSGQTSGGAYPASYPSDIYTEEIIQCG